MVSAASDCNRVLLQRTKSRQGLAGVRNACVGAPDEFNTLVGVGGNPAHVLENVQRCSLSFQHKAGVPGEVRDDIAVLHLVAVLEMALYLHLGIEYREHTQRDFQSAQNAVCL